MKRVFRLDDQLAFARISGDWNPVHVDPLAARRTFAGRPIVHGIHAVLWALEAGLDGAAPELRPTELKVDFIKPIGIDSEVWLDGPDLSEARPRFVLHVDGSPAVRIRARFASQAGSIAERFDAAAPGRGDPLVRSLEDLEGAHGQLPLHCPDGVDALFPGLRRRLGPTRLAAMLATTRLVGMECPGLHSLFSEITFKTPSDGEGGSSEPVLAWRVERADSRFSVVTVSASAPGLDARLRAFVRPPPQPQASCASLKGVVSPQAFEGQRALVVGGSRGIGELTAKLLALGGASVVLTYRSGEADARRVVEEIRAVGAEAEAIRFDVEDPGDASPWPAGFAPTHLYYFATPPIMVGSQGRFHRPLFERFARVYVTGFADLVGRLMEGPGALRAALCPSSVAVDELPPAMAEYSAAKAAGEVACDVLAKTHGLRIARPRLPRIATDQTATVAHAETTDPVPLMRELLLEIA